MQDLQTLLSRGPYQAYAYAYPHKTAYRDLAQPIELAELWKQEDRTSLFGYLHVPFCTYRCGFCNLFALGRPAEDLVDAYVKQLVEQIRVVSEKLGEHRFVRFALGGGTPSYLQPSQLETIFVAVNSHLNVNLQAIPVGIEVSPETATYDRLKVCREAGVDRVSMGVQSFVAAELKSLVRPVQRSEVVRAIDAIRVLQFPTLNLDLIYGISGQTAASLIESVRTALEFAPEEIYLYPLYVRSQTGLGKIQGKIADANIDRRDPRADLYKVARDMLLSAGYSQVSMRMFRSPSAPDYGGPAYSCQNDGMIGMGCGARSYARSVHYSDRYAVARTSVSEIIKKYVQAPVASFEKADYGFSLDRLEQQRRFVIQSLLVRPGLQRADYEARFGTRLDSDMPELHQLIRLDLARWKSDLLELTDEGLANADIIGPWLSSDVVIARMSSYASA